MDVHYMNTGTGSTPRYRNDISANLVKQLLLLLGHTADSFTVSLQNGLICIYMQRDVVFVKSLEEFYNTEIKTELTMLPSSSSLKRMAVLQNTLLLLSGKSAESRMLKDSVLFLRLFVLPLMSSFDCKLMAEMILLAVQRVLLHSDCSHGYYDVKMARQLSMASVVNLVRKLRVLKGHMDRIAVCYQCDETELDQLHGKLRAFIQHADKLSRHVRAHIKNLSLSEPIGLENYAHWDHLLHAELSSKLTSGVMLYTTIGLLHSAMIHYMGTILSVNTTKPMESIRNDIATWIEEARVQAFYVFEFLECCRPGNIQAVSVMEVDDMMRWMLRFCNTRITRVAIEDGVPIAMVPNNWSVSAGRCFKQKGNTRAIAITNYLLGELDWTDDPSGYSYFRFETASNRTDSNVYTIRLDYPKTLLLTTQCCDNSDTRVIFQSEDMADPAHSQWKVIPIFLDDVTSDEADHPFVVITPIAYPHMTLAVSKSRFSYRLSLCFGDPGPEGYWKLSKLHTSVSCPHENGQWSFQKSCLKDSLPGEPDIERASVACDLATIPSYKSSTKDIMTKQKRSILNVGRLQII